MDHWTPIFIAITGVAVMLQAGILLAMYLGMRQTGARIEAIADEVKIKLLPAVDHAEAFLTDRAGSKIQDRGVIPLLSIKGRDAARFAGFHSIASPSKPLAGRWSA